MTISLGMRILLACVLLHGSADAATETAAAEEGEAGFAARCKSPGVELCLALNSQQEIARLRMSPPQLAADNQIHWDGHEKAARFTIPPRSPADSSGQLHIGFPRGLNDVYFSFDVRYPAELLRYRFKGGGGWKIFVLGQGREGCAPYEVVGNNPYYRGYPSFYHLCGQFRSVAVQNPFGDDLAQFDYQPGGDTACVRHPDRRAKPCARFEPDTWVTYQVHVEKMRALLEVWQTVRGHTLKIIEYPLQPFPATAPSYEWLKLTPYNTGKDASEEHPWYSLWYRRVIVSTRRIPFPGQPQ